MTDQQPKTDPRSTTTASTASTTSTGPDLTEATNATIAAAVAARFRDRLAYVRSTDKAQAVDRAAGWLQYRDGVWTREGADAAALQAVEDTTRALLADVTAHERDSTRLRERSRDLLNALNRLPAIVQVAKYKLDRPLREFNPDHRLLNVQNGTLDLRALDPKVQEQRQAQGLPPLAVLRPHRADDRCTFQVHAPYHPDAHAQAPGWEKFLDEVFAGDTEVIALAQRALGYTLLGANPEHAMFLCHGGGGNGKNTLLETVGELLSGYSSILSPDVLVSDYVRTGSSLQPEIAQCRDTRMILSSEPRKGVLNGHRIKSWTGDEFIQIRMLYGDPETIRVTFTLWLMTNVLPDLNEVSVAVKRRLHVIPFTVSFEGREDLDLKAKLATEREGILAWLMEGLRQWYVQGGLNPPAIIEQAATDWYEGASMYECIFGELLVRGKSYDRVLFSTLTQALTEFIYSHEEDFPRVTVNRKLVEDFIKSRGLVKRTVGGQVWVYGVRMADEDDSSDDLSQEAEAEGCLGATDLAFIEVMKCAVTETVDAGYLAQETGLPRASLYTILARLANSGIIAKYARGQYGPSQPNLSYALDESQPRTHFLADLIERLLREKAEGHTNQEPWPVHPEWLAPDANAGTGSNQDDWPRLGFAGPNDAAEMLSLMARRGHQLVEQVPPGAEREYRRRSYLWYHSQEAATVARADADAGAGAGRAA